ncbi:MAG: hypothetical protein ACI841_001306 [Planctomycetota bacterium]|jgi:hypothetical protein
MAIIVALIPAAQRRLLSISSLQGIVGARSCLPRWEVGARAVDPVLVQRRRKIYARGLRCLCRMGMNPVRGVGRLIGSIPWFGDPNVGQIMQKPVPWGVRSPVLSLVASKACVPGSTVLVGPVVSVSFHFLALMEGDDRGPTPAGRSRCAARCAQSHQFSVISSQSKRCLDGPALV